MFYSEKNANSCESLVANMKKRKKRQKKKKKRENEKEL